MTTSLVHAAVCVRPNADLTTSLEADVDVAAVGGKAHALGRLIRGGLRVPPGFVLHNGALEVHLREARIEHAIRSLCEDADFARADTRASVSATIRELICGAPLPDVVRDELAARADCLLIRGPVVVRSSAVGEDSEAASFAGQLDSVLHVADAESLERAVLSCWASFWSERALFYRRARRMQAAGMGVVVQQQVDARAAGVMFTDDGSGALLIEYVHGLGDELVAGAVDPGRISIDRATGAIRHLGERIVEAEAIVCTAGGIESMLAAAERVESEFGRAQDVEWAMSADGTLFIVQSRPITASLSVGRETSPSPTRQVAWSNANVNENFPAPISPLLYSVASAGYTHYFRNLGRAFGISPRRLRAMEPAFSQIIGVHGGRMYYNLTNIHAVIRLAPFGDALASSFDTFVGAEEEPPHSEAGTSGTAAQIAEVVLIAARTAWQYLFLKRRLTRFERNADQFADRSHPDILPRLPLAQLRALLAEFMEIRCHRWKDASLADTAAMVCYSALEGLISRAYPDKAGAAHTSLLKAIPGVVSNEPVHRLWDLSRLIRKDDALWRLIEHGSATAVLEKIETEPRFVEFRTAFNKYLNDWGFRCSSELMLTVPTFQEEPAPLLAMLRAYSRLDAESPVECMARQSDERELETARALAALGRLRIRLMPWMTWAAPLRVLLPWTHASIRYRERARLKQALLYSRLRLIALAVGDELVRRDILSTREDVFWLTVAELDELASGGAMFAHSTRDMAALRAGAHAKLSAMTPADSFTLAQGEYLDDSSTAKDSVLTDSSADGVLRGIAACTGCVTGRASVLTDVTEAERLSEGDVLVTRQTDPGWGPVFFLISGLVIERGGMLSHGAILAREFGIPCIVGVREATRVIPNGATITVDADKERVHVAA
ncbi:MAG TPA: PEP/pyruvate-binding domain-containing protein [Gemmatimonadaceae bacterium]|nr:PEP/pyruvate-binding domain-containing protein [Gemmatimonadaceae bacterium]